MGFKISGGMEKGVLGKPDALADRLGQDEMPPELRCVGLNSCSESEGITFGGYAGDSGDCTSSEGS